MFAHDFRFDPSYGYDEASLLAIPPPPSPPDFAEFWRGVYDRARDIDPRPILRGTEGTAASRIRRIEFRSWEGVPIRGWLLTPASGKIRRGMVCGHGYGGREAPDSPLLADTAVLFPCLRGLSLSAMPGVPALAAGHVLHGIGHRDTYIHLGCAADLWCGVSALEELFPGHLERIDYMGQSFGGGIGALALPWDARLRSGVLVVPSFGNHPIRLQCRCEGSGESVRAHAVVHPRIVHEVLPYFDAAIAASHTRKPVLVAAAAFDPAVPPPGQYSVYNALAGPRELFPLPAGHFGYPGQAQSETRLARTAARFLSDTECPTAT
jgi:cephalosporin-C deacetylase